MSERSSEEKLRLFLDMRADPFKFASECIFTQDPIDQENPIKAFPSHLEYLRLYFKLWQKERLIAVPKSRRMYLTWGTLVLYLWDTMFHPGRINAVISKKEQDADELIERMKFMIQRIPEGIFPDRLKPVWNKTYCSLDFPEVGSKVLAFPSGSDQLRMYAFSGIMADEMAFWPDAKEMYSSTFPTIENKGRMTGISSAAPGFFQDLVFDRLNDASADREPVKRHFPMSGIELWKNSGNKFSIYQVHYSADPAKRDPSYIEGIKSSMPISQFNREFQIVWDSFEGRPVFQDFDKEAHVSHQRIEPWNGLPLIIGVDWGLTPSAVVCQLQERNFVVIDEMIEINMGADRFMERLSRYMRMTYPAWSNLKDKTIMYVDPAGFQRAQTDESKCVEYASKWGFLPRPGPVRWEERRSAVERFLTLRTKEGASFKVDATHCPMLVKAFEGGYQYPEKAFDIEPAKIRPLKNEYSHCSDALQYAMSGIQRDRPNQLVKVPAPSYSWSKREKWNQLKQ